MSDLIAAFEQRDARQVRAQVSRILASEQLQFILHPLGFYMTKLHASGPDSIRLHYWPLGQEKKGTAMTPYHDHVWALRSCILVGTLQNVLLRIVPDPSGTYETAYIKQTGGVDEVLSDKKNVRIETEARDEYHAGEIYDIPPRVFHYTDVAPEQATVTVVWARVVVEGGPRTLVPVGFSSHAPSREPIDTPTNVQAEIALLLSS